MDKVKKFMKRSGQYTTSSSSRGAFSLTYEISSRHGDNRLFVYGCCGLAGGCRREGSGMSSRIDETVRVCSFNRSLTGSDYSELSVLRND